MTFLKKYWSITGWKVELLRVYWWKNINLLGKLNFILPCSSLLMIYKLFVKPHLDYGVTEYDQANNSLLGDKVESLQ